MEIKKVIGNSIPKEFENLQGGILINVLPDKNSDDTYTYYQVLVSETDSERLIKLRDKMLIELYSKYITSTGWIWEKKARNVDILKNLTEEEFYNKYKSVIDKQEEYRNYIRVIENKEENSTQVVAITPLQAKLKLKELGLLESVNEILKQDETLLLYWDNALVIEKDHKYVVDLANALGLTKEQLDVLFNEAKLI